MRKEQFHSMYTQWWMRKVFRDYTYRSWYKHWNGWCCKKNGKYCFEKGYNEDYVKYMEEE